MKIRELEVGTIFDAGPIDVRILEHFAGGRTLLIANTCIADRHFADEPFKIRPEKPTANLNNWHLSNLNRELNTELLAAFDQAEGPIRSKDILTADWSLADHAGGEGYGGIQAKIALLTDAMYRKYDEQNLLTLDDWWWLITPCAGNAYMACRVRPDGSMDFDRTLMSRNGVRPAFFVRSDVEVLLKTDKEYENVVEIAMQFGSYMATEKFIDHSGPVSLTEQLKDNLTDWAKEFEESFCEEDEYLDEIARFADEKFRENGWLKEPEDMDRRDHYEKSLKEEKKK